MPFNYVSFYGLPFTWNSDESTTDLGQNNLLKAGIKLQYTPARNHYLIAAYNYGLTSTENPPSGPAIGPSREPVSGTVSAPLSANWNSSAPILPTRPADRPSPFSSPPA